MCGELKGTFISCIFDGIAHMGRPLQFSCVCKEMEG